MQKKKRIAAGSGEKMRKPGAKGAPSAQDFTDAAKTAKKNERRRCFYAECNRSAK